MWSPVSVGWVSELGVTLANLQDWPGLQYLRGVGGGEVAEEVSLEEEAAAGPGRMAGFGALVGTRQGDAGAWGRERRSAGRQCALGYALACLAWALELLALPSLAVTWASGLISLSFCFCL